MELTSTTAAGPGRNERGATSVEYGLMVVAIAALLVALFFILGNVTSSLFSDSCSTIDGQAQVAASC